MGCASSKPAAQPVETVNANSTSTTTMCGTKVVKDSSLMMCPYYNVAPDKVEAFTAKTEALYQKSVESEDVVFYGAAKNDTGVHMRQGFRSAQSLVTHLEKTKVEMTQTLQTASLDHVEVHGTKKDIMKVKKSYTRIEQTDLQFYEHHPKMYSVSKPTEFSGQAGSDELISIHVTISVSTVTEMRTLEPKVKPVHRRCIGLDGNHSFFFSRCWDAGKAKIVATFKTIEDALEHVMCMAAHLGSEALNFLEMHGPSWMLDKIKGLLSKVGEGLGDCAELAKKVLTAAAEKAKEDALMAYACAQAAAKAVAQRGGDALNQARDKAMAGLQAIQKKAKALADKAYDDAKSVTGATEAWARSVSKAAYKKAMDTCADIHQEVDRAAKAAYDEAIAAGKAVLEAEKAAEAAAQAAAKAAQDEVKELYEDAKAVADKAKEKGEEAYRAAVAEAVAVGLAMELGLLEVERLLSEAAKAVRKALFKFYDVVKAASVSACEATYKTVLAAKEVTEDAYKLACDKSKAAAYAVASAGEEMYVAAYNKALAAGKAANDAKDAAMKASEYAAGKVVDVWKQGEQLCSDALSAAKRMLEQGVQAVVKALGAAVTWVLDVAKAIRRTLWKGTVAAADWIHAGMMDFGWAVGAAVEFCGDALDSAVKMVGDAASAVKHHFDNAITMIPHFTFGDGDREKFTQHCASFQQVSVKTTDTLFYGVCHKQGGACIRQGYRNASSMVSYVRESEATMTEITKYSTLQKVEVHGTRRQLVKVKKQITKIQTVKIEFFETDRKVKAIRRATECSGADKLLTAHVSMKVTKEQTKVVTHKLRALHAHARDHAGVMHFSLSKCIKTGELKIMGTFADMEAGVETLGMACAHLGYDILNTLEMHGPQTELAKVKGILGSATAAAASAVKAEEKAVEAAVSSAYNWLKGSLLSVEKKAEDKLYEAKAVCEAAEKAVVHTVTDDIVAARNKVCETIESMSKMAEEAAQTVYQDTMKAEKMVESEARDLAKQSYKSAMEAYSEVRQAADEAGRKAYEQAIKAKVSVEEAVEAAHKAADVAASAAKEEMIDAADAAASELASAEAGIKAAEKRELEMAAASTKAAADFCGKAVEAVASTISKDARALMLRMHNALQTTTTEVVMVKYKKEVTTTATEERVEIVNGRARAAAWSVTVTREQTYYVTYEKTIIERSGPEEALKAAAKAADDAVQSVLGVWKKAETAAADAWEQAKDMLKKDEKAVVDIWNKGTSYALDEVTAVRNGMYAGAHLVEEEVDEAVEDVAWAVNTVVEDVTDAIDAAHNTMTDRIKAWYDAIKAAEVKALRAVADAADGRADRVERKQKVCC